MAKTLLVKRKSPPTSSAKALAKNDDPVIKTYRALQPLMVAYNNDENSVHMRQFGDYVPEVDTWKKPGVWLRTDRIETVHINQSELDRWRREYEQRIAEEDEVKAEAESAEQELLELQARIRELEAQRASKAPDFNAPPKRPAEPSQTIEQKIDFGGVRMRDGSIPRAVPTKPVVRELPDMTRAPQPASNVGQNRTAPTTVRRVVRKKG